MVSVQGHSGVSIDRPTRKGKKKTVPYLHCYPTDDPAGGQTSVWLGLSCTEVSSLLVCAGIMD